MSTVVDSTTPDDIRIAMHELVNNRLAVKDECAGCNFLAIWMKNVDHKVYGRPDGTRKGERYIELSYKFHIFPRVYNITIEDSFGDETSQNYYRATLQMVTKRNGDAFEIVKSTQQVVGHELPELEFEFCGPSKKYQGMSVSSLGGVVEVLKSFRLNKAYLEFPMIDGITRPQRK
jgi:hypothetical protein